jgi:N-acetylated-alpha-linked acidic dipeptidase
MVFCSWDAEEEGLIGSTEWVEQHAKELENAVIYINVDVAVAGPDFSASAVPSLKQFVRDITKSVPSPTGPSVYEVWRNTRTEASEHRPSNAPSEGDVRVGDLGSGSDFTPFLQHAGVPSTDIGSGGPYGVYHSVFDNYAWYTKNADPRFIYLQEMARVFGLEALRMADTDVLPYDYVTYSREIELYLAAAHKRANEYKLGAIDFTPAELAATHLNNAGQRVRGVQLVPPANPGKLNTALRGAEAALLSPAGLPNRPWYKHTIFAPGEYTGYAAAVIPGVNEAIDAKDENRTRQQLQVLADALNRAAQTITSIF